MQGCLTINFIEANELLTYESLPSSL